MKHFNFNQSLRNLVNNLKGLFILSLALTTFGIGNAWGATTRTWNATTAVGAGKGTAKVTVSPGSSVSTTLGESKETTSSSTVTVSVSQSATFSTSFVSRSAKFEATAATGYSFNGWYSSSACTGSASNNSATWKDAKTGKDSWSVTYYAKFTPNPYTVTFDAITNGGTCSTSSKTVTFDGSYNDLPAPTKPYFTFKGWYDAATGGNKITSSTKVSNASNHTLYAQWETATFYGRAESYASPAEGGGTYISINGGSPTQESQYIAFDYSNKQSDNVTAAPTYTAHYVAKAKDGYEFVGWYTAANGVGTKTSSNADYNEDFQVTSTNADARTTITRYAYFKALQYYYFKAQAGKVGTGNVYASFTDGSYSATSDIKTERATTLAQSQSTSTYTAYFKAEETDAAYHFAGWYTDAACTEANRVSTNPTYSEQISGSTATTEASAKTITRYAKFVQELTPEVTANYSGSPKAMFVDDEIASAFSFLNTSEIGSGLSVVSSNNNIITYDAANNKVIAKNEGTATLTFTQTKQEIIKAGEFSFTFNVSKIANTLTADATHSMKVDETWNNVYSNKNSDGTITTESTDASIAYFDVANNRILAPNSESKSFNSEEVTITISQAATYKYTAAEKTIKVTVNKHDNHISINGSQDSYQASIYMEAQQSINLTANNTDYAGSPITATQTAGNTIAALNAAQTQVASNHNLGDATWTVSQPENYKYKAANASFTIHVVKEAEATDCYVLKEDAEKSYGKNGDHYSKEFSLSGPGAVLSFNMWKYSWANDIGMKVFGYDASGNELFKKEFAIGDLNDYATKYSYPIDSRITKIKIQNGSGSWAGCSTLNCYASEVRVTRATYLNASDFTINTQSDNTTLIYPGTTGTGSFQVDYSLANGGDLKLVCDNPKFTISKTSQPNVDCKTGSFNVAMTYTSQEAGTDYAHIVIYNNVYRKEITVTGITQKHQQTLNWKENFDKMSKGSEEKNAASSSHGLVTYTSTNTNVIRVDNDANGYATILVAVAKGESEITATAAGDDEYDPKSISKTIPVTEDHVQYIIWNQSLMGLKYEMGSTKTLNAYATSEEEGNIASSRPITYTSDNTSVVTVNGNQLIITGIGTAIVTARQAGGTIAGITYEAVEKTNKVIVKDPSAKCESFVYEQDGNAEEFFSMELTTPELRGTEHTLSGEPAKLTFYAKREYWNLAIDYSKGNIVVDAYTSSGWQQVLNCGEPPIGSYQEYSVNLNRDVTKIRFRRPKGGQGYHYIAGAKIERARYIETTTPSVFQANVGEVQEHKISLSYSNITSDLLLTLAGGATSHFSIDKTTIEGECGDAKKNIELTISYAPTKDTEGNVDGKEQETLNITDGTTVYQVPLYGKASKVDQHIVWDINDNNNVYTIEQVTLTATTKTNLDQAAGELAYHTVGATTAGCATIDNNILSFSKDGIVYVEAYTIASDKYNPATSVTKSWTVSKTPTKVTTNPTISGDIISGTDIASLSLNGGAAQNTVNNQAVEGTFAITGGNLVNVGQQTLTITFTPNNTDMYEGCTTTISVNVVQRKATAEEVGTPSAASITYGNAINTSVLSGNGSLAGTWSWVDEDANKATPNVGTVDNLNVIFTPNDGNVKPVAATVSLTVTKADAQLTWTTAPTDVEISEAVTYVATSNHSESAITYSITAGGEYATIDATTGALTMLKAGTITVQAYQDATTNYNAATITTTTTITGQLENKFTNAAGDHDWKNEDNWTNGVPTEENPDVIIAGEVIIDEPISVGGLTIEVSGKVTVINDGSLNVNGTSADRDTYGNLFIKNGGDVTIATEGNVRVNDFVIESSIGTNGTSQSGQITNTNKVLYVNGAYIDINLDPTGKANDTQWYGFTVPFPVDVHDGVARKEGDTFRKLTYGTDYMFAEYDMNQRLNSGKGWKYITTSQLQPGRFYYITFNGDYNTYSFKAATNTIITSYETYLTTNGTGANANWNAVGNSALRHVTASYGTTDDEKFVQVYQNGLSQYMTVRTNDATFVVGCPFFVQATESTILKLTDATTDHANSTYAPLRKASPANRSIKMVINPENGGYSDQVYMRTTTDVKDEYIIGRDLAKAGVGTASVQMWINAYGQKLSVNETEIIGEEAIFPLGIYAPKAGGYRLTIDETDTPTYLMENGVVIWDFANGSYVVDLSKGTNNDYSIVRTAPNTPGEATDIYSAQQNNQSINKVIFRNKMYIINNAHTYDAQGQTIR